MNTWSEVEPILREKAYRTLGSNPQILLEQDGGPGGIDADLFYARLIGFEDEIVQDAVLLSRVEREIHVAITRPLRLADFNTTDPVIAPEPMRVAVYRLQSGFATLSVDGMYGPPVEHLRQDFTAKIAYLRYRRRA